MILKYYNENADVVVVKLTNQDVQKFLDDYFDSAQRMHQHPDRDGDKVSQSDPASVAVYNSLTEGMWKFNGPLRALAQIHQLFVNRAAAAKEKSNKQIKKIIEGEEVK